MTDLFDHTTSREVAAARQIQSQLDAGQSIDRKALNAAIRAAFSDTDAKGAWTQRQSFEILELATTLHLRARNAPCDLAHVHHAAELTTNIDPDNLPPIPTESAGRDAGNGTPIGTSAGIGAAPSQNLPLTNPDGRVDPTTFENILNGKLPDGTQVGEPGKRALGMDLTFSAPKSVSALALVGGDKRLLAANMKAVQSAMRFAEKQFADHNVLEADWQTRVEAIGYDPRLTIAAAERALTGPRNTIQKGAAMIAALKTRFEAAAQVLRNPKDPLLDSRTASLGASIEARTQLVVRVSHSVG